MSGNSDLTIDEWKLILRAVNFTKSHIPENPAYEVLLDLGVKIEEIIHVWK